MKLQVLGKEPNEPVVTFSLGNDDEGDIDIFANGNLVAYFHLNSLGKVTLELVRGVDEEIFKVADGMIVTR